MPKRLIIWSDIPKQWHKVSMQRPAESVAESEDLVEQVTSIVMLFELFNRLLEEKVTLSLLRVHTHMCPGGIALGGDILGYKDLSERFGGQQFAQLFADNAKIDLTGCNVANTFYGEYFLVLCGKIFLKRGGGSVIGNTGVGFANPFTGSVYHPCGEDVTATVTAGGTVTLSGHTILVPNNITEGIQRARERLRKLEAKNEKDLEPITTLLNNAAGNVTGPTAYPYLFMACAGVEEADKQLKAKEGYFGQWF